MALNPQAVWRGPALNHGGAMSEFRGLVIHIAEGYYEGTIQYMLHNPDSASSHFVCGNGALGQGNDGDLAQLLDTSIVAYTQINGNGKWISVECAGFTPNALTAAQVETVAQLFAWCHQVHGVKLQLAYDPTGFGLGHHSMGTDGHDNPTDTWTGPTWGHTDCPGPAIYNQKPAILARAIEIVTGDDVEMRQVLVRYADAPTRPDGSPGYLQVYLADGMRQRPLPDSFFVLPPGGSLQPKPGIVGDDGTHAETMLGNLGNGGQIFLVGNGGWANRDAWGAMDVNSGGTNPANYTISFQGAGTASPQ